VRREKQEKKAIFSRAATREREGGDVRGVSRTERSGEREKKMPLPAPFARGGGVKHLREVPSEEKEIRSPRVGGGREKGTKTLRS